MANKLYLVLFFFAISIILFFVNIIALLRLIPIIVTLPLLFLSIFFTIYSGTYRKTVRRSRQY